VASLRTRASQNAPRVRVEDTLKFFWDLYPYRVEFDAKLLTRKRLPKSQLFRSATIHEEVLSEIAVSGKVSTRRNGERTNLYFVNETDALAFFEKVEATATAVTAPRSAEDQAAITPDGTRLKSRLRTCLYWDRYQFEVTFKDSIDQGDQIEKVQLWMNDFKEISGEADRVSFQFGSPRKAYFADENDMIFFKLVFHEHISKIEKALLIKDIDDARGSSEGAH
jgi:hypothetical protein